MTFKQTCKRTAAGVLAAFMTAGLVASAGFAAILPIHATDIDTIASYAPSGTANVAIHSSVSISACSADRAGAENSYEMPSENWSKTMLVDGKLNNGWSTNPYDKEQDRSKPVTLTLTLPSISDISAIALFPNGCFPAKYTVSVSPDGKTYTKVADGTCDIGKPTEPVVHTFASTTAQSVRIDVSERSLTVTADGALVQFGEIAVYGKAQASMSLDRTSLELTVNETDQLVPGFVGTDANLTVTWTSSDESIVSVGNDGTLTAKKVGEAIITASCTSIGLTDTCSVKVTETEQEYDLDSNILLSIFWPPTPDYITDEQYRLMADAGINWVMGAGEETLANPETQKKMLELCAKYGMGMTVSDGNFGNNLLGKTETQIAEYVNNYKNVPGAYGFYILDEPFNPNNYVDAYIALKKANPDAYMHLNFLPGGAYGSQETYYSQMNDWCVLCAEGGYPVDYLIFDNYPFPLQAGAMNRQGFMENLRTCHDVGLANGVKTGTYIQTVCQEVAFRRPTDSEIRYEMYLALAFGYKQLSFFTWFTPENRSEPFKDGIISADGVPNEHYEAIKTINHEILAIGSTLVKCDALEIYLNGETWGQPSIPEDFFVQPADRKNYTVSFLRHEETGRNYLMVVNNNFSTKQSVKLNFSDSIDALWEVSRIDGSLVPLTMDAQALTLELAAGDAMLIALPEDFDHLSTDETEPAAGTNLAVLDGASVSATTSVGSDGYYINLLTDGKRVSDNISTGWRTNNATAGEIVIDLGVNRKLNRVDLYPTGTLFDYGMTFPRNFTVEVSVDGETYQKVAEVTEYVIQDNRPCSLSFNEATARYIRVSIPRVRTYTALCEIEIYYDDGSMVEPPVYDAITNTDTVITYKEGANIALNKTAYASSTTPDATYKQWGWSLEYINDGKTNNGWTSNVKINTTANATEYVIIDFGDLFAVEQVVVSPNGYFPVDYRVELSADGKSWTIIADEKDADKPTSALIFLCPDGPVNARYVRFIGTKLTLGGADGYLLQLGEIEAYGRPVCNKTVLSNAMQAYVANGGDISAKVYANAEKAMANEFLTQTQANHYAKALGYDPEPTEPETTTPTEFVTEPITIPATAASTTVIEPVTAETATSVTMPAPEPDTTIPIIDISPATEPSGTEAAKSTEFTAPSDEGCGSAMGGGVAILGILSLASATLLIRIRRKE